MDKEQQELILKFSIFEQQIQQLQEQLQRVEQSILELERLNIGLDELKDSKEKEILASIGRGIFVKSKLLSEELIVDIGGKNFVKKSIPETQKIMREQINKLENIRAELENNLEQINAELTEIYLNAQEKNRK